MNSGRKIFKDRVHKIFKFNKKNNNPIVVILKIAQNLHGILFFQVVEFLSLLFELRLDCIFQQKENFKEISVVSGRSQEKLCSCCLILSERLLLGKPSTRESSNKNYAMPGATCWP